MRKTLILFMMTGVFLAACGRKEMPQVDTGKPPHIEALKHDMAGNSLRLTFAILGGAGPVGYQIDRAEIDPHCNCPGFWQRFFEQPAIRGQKGKVLSHTLNLRTYKRAFAFRIRAVDFFGNLGAWSNAIRVRAEKMLE
ncbi:MAG: hypothetical protein Q9M27_01055 [Mariprofundaceae bacterium]|nr:hypothetical protein [Mariprofundaceae bacterium]